MAEDASAEAAAQERESRNGFALSGCEPVHVPLDEIADYEFRYEYWDAETETAWEVRDVSAAHDEPCDQIVELVRDIGKVRGMRVTTLGSVTLVEEDDHRNRVQAAHPDKVIYLKRPEKPIQGNIIVKGPFPVRPVPDVLLEVDLTTDVRDRKLDLYASWGIPELWVEVPDASMPSKRKRPGFTIHTLEGGKYQTQDESTAFPTWSAREIHRALNEPFVSNITVAALRRVGEAMGRVLGTEPDSDPFLRAVRQRGIEQGIERGRLSALEALLAARGIDLAADLLAERLGTVPHDAFEVASSCSDADDFLRRLGIQR